MPSMTTLEAAFVVGLAAALGFRADPDPPPPPCPEVIIWQCIHGTECPAESCYESYVNVYNEDPPDGCMVIEGQCGEAGEECAGDPYAITSVDCHVIEARR
jgi:hypothetical protein